MEATEGLNMSKTITTLAALKRRKRQAKPDVRARSGRYARMVNPRAKTPAVQMLTISKVPSDVLDAIDELAAGQDRSRSSFVRRELQRIVAEHRAKAA
jgi:hypothetical protein